MIGRAIFLDRDGTLMADVGYPRHPDQVTLLPGAAKGLAACREAGFRLAIISNQSGVGRGYFGADTVWAVHQRLLDLLEAEGVPIDDAQYCLHAPEDDCACRKPSPLMIERFGPAAGRRTLRELHDRRQALGRRGRTARGLPHHSAEP
jgi:D-glycero-D-manno-heptose 1,7-bisphosphate phosphatase